MLVAEDVSCGYGYGYDSGNHLRATSNLATTNPSIQDNSHNPFARDIQELDLLQTELSVVRAVSEHCYHLHNKLPPTLISQAILIKRKKRICKIPSL